MARKRPESEIVKALNSIQAEQRVSDLEARLAAAEAEHIVKARAYCESIGLTRKADEPYDAWLERVRKHLRTTVYGRLVA